MAAEPANRPQVSWPRTLGIIMIVFGALGILCNGSSTYGNYGYKALQAYRAMAAKAGTGKPLSADQIDFLKEPLMRNWNLASTAAMALLALLAVVLLVSGVGMVSRHAWAVRAAASWAGSKILIELVIAMGGWVVQHRIIQAIQGGMLKADAVPEELLNISMGSLLAQVALGVAFPVFVLIWLSLPNTKEETVHWT